MIGVFPKGARFLFVRPPRGVRRRSDKLPTTIKAAIMKTKQVYWPIKFVITTIAPSGRELEVWTLDQRIRDKYNERAWQRLYNEVQDHLHSLHLQTECQYRIESWGYAETVEANLWRYGLALG